MSVGRRLLLAWVALAAMATVTRAQERTPEVRTYVVQPGDSAWSIAEEFYGSGNKYPIIYKYNDFVAKPPFLLKPGQLLRLPILGQGPEAQLEWLLKDVKAKPPRALDWLQARERMNLWRLYRVATGDDSAAHIVFEDLSDLKLRENALLVIYGASATAARTARRDKVEVKLEEGTLQGGLAALDERANPKPLVVNTPSGQVDLLAKLAQVQVELTASIVSVYDGSATVKAQGRAVPVKGGQGTVVEKGKRPERARPLPDAPAWAEEDPGLVAAVAGHEGSWEAAWRPAERAATYRVELARDEAFNQLLYDAEVGAGVTRVRLAELGPGRYGVRVSTRDADKLESAPGKVRTLEVVALEPSRAVTAQPDGVLEAVGFLQLEVPEEAEPRISYSVDGGPTRPGAEPIRLGPGTHEVVLTAGGATTKIAVAVLAVSATIDIDGEPLDRDEPAIAHLRVVDERGEPALLPGVVLETSRGESLPMTEEEGGYRAEVPPPGDDSERVAVRAKWLGGALGAREIAYLTRALHPPRVPLAFVPRRSSRFVTGALVAPRPETKLGLETTAVHVEEGPGLVTVALEGEVAFSDWGLSAGFVMNDIRLEEGRDPQSRIRDLSLMARRAFGDDGGVVFAPYLRMSIPFGDGHEERLAGFEPGAILRLSYEALFFDARLAFLFVPAAEVGPRSGADLVGALGWQASPVVTLALSGEALGDLDGNPWKGLIGFGATFDVSDVRLGLGIGLGMGDTAKGELGAVVGRLSIDVGGDW